MRTPKAWGQPCPNPDCAYAQMLNRGNIRAVSTDLTQSGKRRIFQCTKCGRLDPLFRDAGYCLL